MNFNPVYENVNALCAKKGDSVQSVIESTHKVANSDEILKIGFKCKVTRSEVADGFARAEGLVEYKVLYMDSDKKLRCDTFTTEFSAKTPTEQKNGNVRAECFAVDCGISSVMGDEIRIASVIETVFTVFDCEKIDYLASSSSGFYFSDGTENYVECKRSDKVRTEFALSDKTLMDECCFSKAVCVINKRSAGVESVTVEGEVVLDIIGTRGGEICSQTVSLPFSEVFECDGAGYGDTVVINADVTFCDCVVVMDADGNRLDGVVKCTFEFALYKESEFACVNNVFSITKELLPTLKSHNVCAKIGNYTVSERVDGTITLDDNMPVCDTVLSACAFDPPCSLFLEPCHRGNCSNV